MDSAILTNEGPEKGIFFRSPIQFVYYDWYSMDWGESKYPMGIHRILNIFRMKKARNHAKHDNAAGFKFYEFAWPIYFSRKFRSLEYISEKIQISSYGYEGYKNHCSGYCEKETTTFKFKFGGLVKTLIKVNHKEYNFTYKSSVEKFIKENTKQKEEE